MKPIRYILALITIGYYIILGLIYLICFLFFGYFAFNGFIFLIIPGFFLGELLRAIFNRNYIEELFFKIEELYEKFTPIERINYFLIENKIIYYGRECLDELSKDLNKLLTQIKNRISQLKDFVKRSILNLRQSKLKVKSIIHEKVNSPIQNYKPISLDNSPTKNNTELGEANFSNNSNNLTFKEIDIDRIEIEETYPQTQHKQLSLPFDEKKRKKRKPIKDINWIEINEKKIRIGEVGELLAIKFETQRLIDIGIQNPKDHIVHASKLLGDGLGYDIISINESKSKIYIEVKTSSVSKSSDMILTQNEYSVLKELKDNYFIYLVNYSTIKSASITRLSYEMITNQYKAYPDSYRLKKI